ncbi:MAG: NACHT domain-containing protein, partial [Cyanobium sp.]
MLGVSSYNSVKGDPHAESVLRLFTIDRTLLFVGCGDTVQDPNFSQLIAWGKQALKDVAPRHVLLCRASEVEAFQTKLKDAPWLQPLAYGEAYGDLVPFLRGLAPSPSDRAAQASRPASALSGLDLRRYRQAIIKQYGRLKLEELDATSSDLRPVKATGLFIEQTARECVEFLPRALELPKELQRRLRREEALEGREMIEDELESLRRSYLDQSPRPIAEVVADPALRKLVVLGDPGSGKSLLLQVLALRWAEGEANEAREEPLPLLIELRDYARLRHEGRATGFLDYLANAESLRWRFEREPLEQWLRQKPSRVLFDGLDEVFDHDLRREVATAIHRFADDHPAAQVVVSSRVIGF